MSAKETLITLEKKEIAANDATILLVLLTVGLSILDFYSHPNMFQADFERRKMLIDVLGPLAKNLGNYGLSAIPAMTAVFIKHTINSIFTNESIKKITKQGFIAFISSIIALNALIESFPNNNEPLGDFAMGAIGIAMGVASAELIARKIKKNKIIK